MFTKVGTWFCLNSSQVNRYDEAMTDGGGDNSGVRRVKSELETEGEASAAYMVPLPADHKLKRSPKCFNFRTLLAHDGDLKSKSQVSDGDIKVGGGGDGDGNGGGGGNSKKKDGGSDGSGDGNGDKDEGGSSGGEMKGNHEMDFMGEAGFGYNYRYHDGSKEGCLVGQLNSTKNSMVPLKERCGYQAGAELYCQEVSILRTQMLVL